MSPATLPTPAPVVTPETTEFWAAAARGTLLLRRCNRCGTVIWFPRPYCPACASLDTSWFVSSGRGTVYSYTVVHRSTVAGYRQAVPYVIAYVELAEGPRILTNIVGCPPEQVTVGMPVTVVFHSTGDGSALYRFEPA